MSVSYILERVELVLCNMGSVGYAPDLLTCGLVRGYGQRTYFRTVRHRNILGACAMLLPLATCCFQNLNFPVLWLLLRSAACSVPVVLRKGCPVLDFSCVISGGFFLFYMLLQVF